ncbi:flagellar motor switch protein FliN/FliY [Rosenbergiella nectarea]|uniref:Flagellar motor switch protein FliN n=1 Tax=Rosenbergiella nectarea TaxID=988801 RepID=A0A1H9JY03_9GAMM|nr:FliM/FliN family flagellar motor switch protein [Rosenbergiella nectarea]SEQ91664.1 flagellar motor switch protein FliN/FliY [Rosenbergiella nectarea]
MNYDNNTTPSAFSLDDIHLDDLSPQGADPVSNTDYAQQKADERKRQLFNRIPLTLTLEVASVNVSLAELLAIDNSSVIELNKMAGEPLDLKVNGVLFGKAEVVVVNDKYGLRIIEFTGQSLSDLTP